MSWQDKILQPDNPVEQMKQKPLCGRLNLSKAA